MVDFAATISVAVHSALQPLFLQQLGPADDRMKVTTHEGRGKWVQGSMRYVIDLRVRFVPEPLLKGVSRDGNYGSLACYDHNRHLETVVRAIVVEANEGAQGRWQLRDRNWNYMKMHEGDINKTVDVAMASDCKFGQ